MRPGSRQFQKVRVGAQKAARIDFGQTDVELVALEFLQVIAANFCGLGGLANGDALFLSRFLESFADRLHAGNSVRTMFGR